MVVGFGDFLVHFSPIENERFIQADLMKMSFTGAEANVCLSLGFWNEETSFVTRLPNHALSQKGISFLKGHGVNTQNIQYGEGRMGIYFLEKGYSLRPSSVIYDRSDSLFVKSEYTDYDWNSILSNAKAFYLSGITPSLSESLFNCCKRILAECRKRNIPVFYDVNLRPSLCTIEKSRQIFAELYPYVECLIGNEEHLKLLFELNTPESEDLDRLYDLTKLVQKQTKINNIAITVRRTLSANKAMIYASFFNGSEFATSTERSIDVVDRVGSGDAFSAGILYSAIHNLDAKNTVEFATASSALKHTINNDINFSTVQEINDLVISKSRDVKR